MKIIIKHLPTGETWESVSFEDKDADVLDNICKAAASLNIDTQTQGRYYFGEKILSECVINLRA